MERPRALVVAGDEGVVELGDGAWREVGDAAQVAGAAEHEHRVAEQFDPRQRDEVRAATRDTCETCSKSRVVSLIPTMFGVLAAQAPDRLRRDVDAGADRDVVDDDREVGELAARRSQYQSKTPSCWGRA